MNQRLIKISDHRRAENRTKIQLGGLVLKSGLAEMFDITPGEDLQLDPLSQDKATHLLGALIKIYQELEDDHDLRGLTDSIGRQAMHQHFMEDKNNYA